MSQTPSLFARFRNWLRAKLHTKMDQIENPAEAARLKARDYAAQVARFEEELTNVIAEQKSLEKNLEGARFRVADWGEKAKKAAIAGRDDLAKNCVARQIADENLIQSTEGTLGRLSQTVAKLKHQRDVLVQARIEANAAAEVIAARMAATQATEHSLRMLNTFGEGPDLGFESINAQVDRREAHTEALQELAGPTEDMRLLEGATSVDERLALIKAEIKSDTR